MAAEQEQNSSSQNSRREDFDSEDTHEEDRLLDTSEARKLEQIEKELMDNELTLAERYK